MADDAQQLFPELTPEAALEAMRLNRGRDAIVAAAAPPVPDPTNPRGLSPALQDLDASIREREARNLATGQSGMGVAGGAPPLPAGGPPAATPPGFMGPLTAAQQAAGGLPAAATPPLPARVSGYTGDMPGMPSISNGATLTPAAAAAFAGRGGYVSPLVGDNGNVVANGNGVLAAREGPTRQMSEAEYNALPRAPGESFPSFDSLQRARVAAAGNGAPPLPGQQRIMSFDEFAAPFVAHAASHGANMTVHPEAYQRYVDSTNRANATNQQQAIDQQRVNNAGNSEDLARENAGRIAYATAYQREAGLHPESTARQREIAAEAETGISANQYRRMISPRGPAATTTPGAATAVTPSAPPLPQSPQQPAAPAGQTANPPTPASTVTPAPRTAQQIHDAEVEAKRNENSTNDHPTTAQGFFTSFSKPSQPGGKPLDITSMSPADKERALTSFINRIPEGVRTGDARNLVAVIHREFGPETLNSLMGHAYGGMGAPGEAENAGNAVMRAINSNRPGTISTRHNMIGGGGWTPVPQNIIDLMGENGRPPVSGVSPIIPQYNDQGFMGANFLRQRAEYTGALPSR